MFKKMKKLLSVIAICAIIFSLSLDCMTPVNAASDVTVNLSAQKQVIKGFGGINFPSWAGDLTAAQRETAFGNGAGQLGFSILRIHVDENSSNWSQELATAQNAISHGAIVFASPWNPPSDMVESFTKSGDADAKRLRYDKYAAYAQHLNDFVTYMKNNGVNLYAISVQNEPDYAYDWTWWTPTEMLNFMKNNAGSINCRVIAPESFQYLKNMSDPILNDSTALANMDILGAHFYGTSVSNMPYPLFQQKGAGKELWMTEVYVPNSNANSADNWPEALEVGYNMHNALVEGDFQAYVWWYIRRSYGPMKEDGTISKRGYNMAHFSKFIRPGYIRVDATKNPNTNVYASAYTGDNKVVIVAINKGTSSVSQRFVINGATVSSVTPYTTTGSVNMQAGSNIAVSSGAFTTTLPAQSIITFVGSTGATTPTPTPTPTPSGATPTPTPTPGGGTIVECESMTLGGSYAGTISSPFAGVALYANNDYCAYNQYFANPTHSFSVRGCSNNSSTARVDVKIGGTTVGSLYFTGTTPTVQTLSNITHATGSQEVRLTVTTDTGAWDAFVDYLQIN